MSEPNYIKCHIYTMDGTVKDYDINPNSFSFDYMKYLYKGELYFQERLKNGKPDNKVIYKEDFDKLTRPQFGLKVKPVISNKTAVQIIVCIIIIAVCMCFLLNPYRHNSATSTKNQYYIDIVSSRLGKDYVGNNVLIVRYQFEHTYDEPKAFGYVLDDKIYQNGVECKKTYWKSEDVTDDYKYSEIKPNNIVEFETCYGLNDLHTPVEVEITKTFSDKVIYSKTINIK